MVFTNIADQLMFFIDTIFAGHIGDESKLAAVGLGAVCNSMLVLSFLTGLNGAQETLTSQAYGSGNHLKLCGVYLNRGRMINITFYIPLALILCFFAETILVAIGQDPKVSRDAHSYICLTMPGIFFRGQFDLTKRFLQAMRITFVPMVVQILSTLLHVYLCFLLVVKLKMGVEGLALATSITHFTCWLLTTIYSSFCIPKIRKAFFCPGREAFRHWCSYLQLSLPTSVMECASWWAFQILSVFAGIIGVTEQAAQTIVATICGLII